MSLLYIREFLIGRNFVVDKRVVLYHDFRCVCVGFNTFVAKVIVAVDQALVSIILLPHHPSILYNSVLL